VLAFPQIPARSRARHCSADRSSRWPLLAGFRSIRSLEAGGLIPKWLRHVKPRCCTFSPRRPARARGRIACASSFEKGSFGADSEAVHLSDGRTTNQGGKHALPGHCPRQTRPRNGASGSPETGALGKGSVAGDEYLHNVTQARLRCDSSLRWVEVCFCETPLDEERRYWEEYFELARVQDAHNRKRRRDLNGPEPWDCCDCDGTEKLKQWMNTRDRPFLELLRAKLSVSSM
jgi:hypothetical protein